MKNLIKLKKEADQLSEEDRAGLAAHLLSTLPAAPQGADDDEADRRDAEMDAGSVEPISDSNLCGKSGESERSLVPPKGFWRSQGYYCSHFIGSIC